MPKFNSAGSPRAARAGVSRTGASTPAGVAGAPKRRNAREEREPPPARPPRSAPRAAAPAPHADSHLSLPDALGSWEDDSDLQIPGKKLLPPDEPDMQNRVGPRIQADPDPVDQCL